ncbi:DDE superfamily endonuclease [Rhizoctonia solani]|uniref:DDE superfamily endonuclease n=1 Tax=Rhizoctonia solani TaxID=456999 RepID=A0A8H7LZK2_9AGAM|nr:DDE superfamily endonuclease [Rhizoctonia solani]
MKGVPPCCIAHACQQLMSPPKERAAAEFILSLADHGFPVTQKDARAYLSTVIQNWRPDYKLCPMNFYELVSHNVPQCCIFNMDKKGGTVGEVNWAKVLVQKSTRPILIQDNGWTNTNVCLSWLQDVFDAETCEKAAGLPRLLIWDGHVSHMSYKAAVYAWENNITLFCLPPHSTALLQPLNKVAFGPLSKALSEEIEKASITGQPAQKEDFPRLYAAARQEALTPKTILKSFEATGLVPFNPNQIDLSTKLPSKINQLNEPASDSPASGGVLFGKIKKLVETPAQTDEGQRYQAALTATYSHLLGLATWEALTHRWANKINIAAYARKDGSQQQAEKKARGKEEERAKQTQKKEQEWKRALKKIKDNLQKKKEERRKDEQNCQKEQRAQERAEIKAWRAEEREQEVKAKEQRAKPCQNQQQACKIT